MADGDPLLIGKNDQGTANTTLVQNTSDTTSICLEAGSLYGSGIAGYGSQDGVYGETTSGVGVAGHSARHGEFGGGDGYGVVGLADTLGTGVYGDSSQGDGVIGKTLSDTRTGVIGSASNGIGVYGTSTPTVALFLGLPPIDIGVLGFSSSGRGIVAASGPRGFAAEFDGRVKIFGDLTVTGAKSALVPHPDGSHRQLY